MTTVTPFVGTPRSRVDGRAKVTGAARYAAEFDAPDLAHGWVVSSAVARGRIARIDTDAAMAMPGVLKIFTHENRPRTAWFDYKHRDQTAPPGHPFRPLYSDTILHSGQPIALVVAETLDIARDAASLVRVLYETEEHATDLAARRDTAYVPPKKRSGIKPPPKPRGDAPGAFTSAPVQVRQESRVPAEYHNPMEPHAATVVWKGKDGIVVHDKTQGAQNSQSYIASVFGLSPSKVQVVAPFVGGAFGSGLRPQYQVFLAVMAALELERSVRVSLTRDQMFTFGHRPETLQIVTLGAGRDGKLVSVQHDAVAETSRLEDYQEVVVNWSGLLYRCDNVALTYRLAQLDVSTPCDMRAPGATIGVFALEIAMDELAHATGIDPVELRLRNHTDRDQNEDKPFTSKELRACYAKGAERFGWSKRKPAPRSMREGSELVGYGFATGVWEAMMMKSSARATLTPDGRLTVATATADIGTGTYTILTQIAADALGVPMEKVTTLIGDSSLPTSPIEGGSWAAASSGAAVDAACRSVRDALIGLARGLEDSPLANIDPDRVTVRDGRVFLTADPDQGLAIDAVMAASGVDKIELEETVLPDPKTMLTHAAYTHSAVFAEVRVDEELGIVRVTRVVNAVAAGRILNPKTARSQILGGVVMGIGMALEEEALHDHKLGRVMNHNFAEYHIPVNADVPDIDVLFVEEHDDKVSPLGVKGLGEIGIVGTAAAIANAIFHATGKRVNDLPITVDKLLDEA
ncbi:xanthine dehydrogenase family protein molybdopterin-binding subunit [Azospirillum doebereinerae]|uniref:Xanthine dehydrogenase family protein molybdopterin-binding subunit n=1 Tax=Azospirillum doebereinerae TaxID=92933 RepID=A0A433J5I1_9PROT|nr:xanthine dehydrogenase family protein molybdopterin-binding subunit [Azospirillum doebereinerae]RUQ67844.1 xanthine dehydrogenase family protein molybdopterin-binding subunit [Azospirillum doebereinerae]